VLGNSPAELVDCRWADHQQEDAANDFEDSVEALEDDPDCEGSVAQIAAPKPVHRGALTIQKFPTRIGENDAAASVDGVDAIDVKRRVVVRLDLSTST